MSYSIDVMVVQKNRQLSVEFSTKDSNTAVKHKLTKKEATLLRDKLNTALISIASAGEHDDGITSPE